MKIRRIIEIEEDTFKRIKNGPDVFNSDTLNALNAIELSKPYDDSGDLISRSVLDEIRQLYKDYQPYLATKVIEFGNALEKLIDNAPTVEPEIPKGEWIKSKDGYTRCSLCGSRGSAIKARFCHHCGADMRRKTTNEYRNN